MAKRGPKPRPVGEGSIDWDGVEPPAELDPAMRAEFLRLVDVLRAAGTLGKADLRLVEMTARTHVLLTRAYQILEQEGMVLKASNNTSMGHPMLNVINVSTMRLKGLLNDLGLTPAASRLATLSPAPASDDPIAQLIDL